MWIFLNTCICVCFCRRSPGCDTHCGIYQDRDETRQIPSDYLWLGWWEKNPRHLEELLHNVSWCGVCGGFHRYRQDPWDKGNLSRGPWSPMHLWEARSSVSHSKSLFFCTGNIQNLWTDGIWIITQYNFLISHQALWFGAYCNQQSVQINSYKYSQHIFTPCKLELAFNVFAVFS